MFSRKIVKFIICIALLTGAFAGAVSAKNSGSEEYTLLSELGIINDKVTIDDKNITRAEFAILIANMHGFKAESEGASQFVDVEDEYFAKSEIQYVTSNGLMNGISKDKFSPGLVMTTESAYKVIFDALGYADYISTNYNSYTAAAAATELSKGVPNETLLTKEAAIRLLCNALETDILDITYRGGSYSINLKSDETPLSEWLELDYTEGIVLAAGDSLVNNDYSAGGGIVIGDMELSINSGKNYADYLGFVCRAYYDVETEELKAIVKIDNKNDTEEYETKYSSYADGVLSYQKDKRIKKITVSAADEVVLNGVPVLASERAAAINNADGKIIINDPAGYDGKIILISSYETYYVGGILPDEATVFDRISSGRALVLDSDKSNIYMSYSDGSELEVSNLKTGDVLTVLKHGNLGDMTVTVSNGKVSGLLSAVNEDEEYIRVEDKEYELSEDFLNAKKVLPIPGVEVTLYLDCFGRIAFLEEGVDDGYTYGFLYKTIISEDDDTLKLKIYNASGAFITVGTTEKTRIDEAVISDVQKKVDAIAMDNGASGTYRLIKYKLNSDGNVTDIDTHSVGASEDSSDSLMRVHTLTSDGSIYKQVPKAFGGTDDIGLKVVMDANTVIMTVPAQGVSDTNVFKIGKSFENDKKYTFEAYKSDVRDIPVDIILFYEETATVDQYAYGFIKDIKLMYDSEEGEVVNALTVVTSTQGEKVFNTDSDFNISNSTVIDKDQNLTPGKGDIIKMSLNSQSAIMDIDVMYDASEGEWLASSTPYGSIYNDHFYYGTVYRKNSGFLQISKGIVAAEVSESVLSPIPLASNVRYMKFESEKSTVEDILFDEILDFESVQSAASEAVIITRAANGVVVAVYE